MTDDDELCGFPVIEVPWMPPGRALVAPLGWPGPTPDAVASGEIPYDEWIRDIAHHVTMIPLGEPQPHARITIT